MNLQGKRIVIASGPTAAPIDDVRMILNRSSGRLGTTIALACARHGAHVIQLAGTPGLTADDLAPAGHASGVEVIRYETIPDLKQALRNQASHTPDAILMASAVLDYIPAEQHAGKKSSSDDEWTLRLVRSEKLIERILEWAPGTCLVGFKLESGLTDEELVARAYDLIRRSGAELVVANHLQSISETGHSAFLVEDRTGHHPDHPTPLQSRDAIADALVNWLASRLGTRSQS